MAEFIAGVRAFALLPSSVATGASFLASPLLGKVSVYLHLNMCVCVVRGAGG